MLKFGAGYTIGLDIGFHFIKIIEVVTRRNQSQVKRLVVVPTGNSPTMPDQEREERVVAVLQAVWKELGLKSRKVYSVIPGRAVFYRPLKIPIVTGDRLEKMIRYEAKQQIPFSLDQILLDYHIFGGVGGELEGVLIAARRDTINDHVRLLAKAGLRPDLIDVSSICLFNATRALEREAGEVLGLVNIGATTTDIIIEHEHVLKFSRSAPVGGNDLTLAVQKLTERTFEECDDLKVRFGSLSSSGESRFSDLPADWAGTVLESDLVQALDGAFERVVTEVRRSIDYYISQPDGMAVSRLLICGGTSVLPGALEFLEDRLGIPVQRLDVARSTALDISDALTAETAPVSLPVCGLVTPEKTEHRVSMDFIPESIQQKKEFESKRFYLVIQTFFLVALIGMAAMYLHKHLQFQSEVLEHIEGVINVDVKLGKELYEVRTQQEEMRKRFQMLNEIAKRRGKIMENLLEIVRITPTSFISINSINIEHDRMVIKGNASSDIGVKSYMEELRLSPFIHRMKNVTREGAGNAFEFEILALRQPNEQEKAFYSRIRPQRMEVPRLRSFSFTMPQNRKHVMFDFYDTEAIEELCQEMLTVLTALVDSKIEYDQLAFRIFNPLTEQPARRFIFPEPAAAMRVYHGEISMCDYMKENLIISAKEEEEGESST